MRRILLLLTALFAANVALAADDRVIKIEGEVKDANTNEPIAYANIVIENTKFGTVTNEDGYFAFSNLKSNTYVLKVSFIGYETESIIITVGSELVIHKHISLRPATTIMNPITITAEKDDFKQKAPVIISVLSEKVFESTNAPDLLHTLPYQSGVRVEYSCQNCGSSQVKINGLDGPYTQILIDGRAVMSSLSGVYGLEQIPVNMIDRVEVVKGIGSALFGSTAIAGTVNIITKEPASNSFSVSSDVEAIGLKSLAQTFNANAALLTKDHKAGVSFYQTFRKRDSYDADDDGFTEMGQLDSRSFGTKGFYRISNRQKMTLEYHTTSESRRGGNKLDQPAHLTDICEMTNYKIHSGGLGYDYLSISGKNHYSAYTSVQSVDRDSYYGSHQDPNSYGLTKDLTYLIGGQGSNKFDKVVVSPMTLTYGAEYVTNSINDRILGYNMLTDQSTNTMATYLQTEWEANKFSLLLGGRLDKHNLIKSLIFSPRVNLFYKPFDIFQLRASYGSGYRAPQVFDEDLHIAQVGGLSLRTHLADNLKPEYSHNLSLSADFYYDFSDNFKTNILCEGFYTDLQDVFAMRVISFDTINNTMYQERYNASGATVYGLNFTAKFAYKDDADLTIGYTIQNSRYQQTEYWSSDPNVKGTDKLLRMPDDYGFITLNVKPAHNFDISASGTYTGRLYVPHFAGYIAQDKLEQSPCFFDINLSLSYTIAIDANINLKISGGMKNIFNSYQSDFDKGADRDANYVYGTMQPRTIFLSAKIATN
ncbi:MAG: TonB-dependent receptor [Bacteroidales bacterium]|jgi:outer membrane receptor for ferrienterochelin and colicins|nr:TonB-dependent receptor [Bacteroidales bacterium]